MEMNDEDLMIHDYFVDKVANMGIRNADNMEIAESVECGYGGAKFPAHILPSLLGPPLVGSSQKVGSI
ncbi:hypothetical protein Aduo_012649 [Ancylostoma duodenale]